MKCPRCGFSNPAGAKFCNQCGAALDEIYPRKGLGQRRAVAIVFADLSGFTALSEKLDPEEVKDLIDNCLKRLAEIIYKYGGYIDKFIGDCIMAIFGAPVAHEDDPLRAVLSSIDLLKELKIFSQETKQLLSISIGINYGLVATGDLGRAGAYTVMGDAVNLAQRLQDAAPRDKIYVSESIFINTKNEIEYHKSKKIKVKGKKEPVLVFVPEKIKRKYSLRKIKELPIIGRGQELNKLQELFSKVKSEQGKVISVIGDAGIGKSKLIYELKKILTNNLYILEGKGIEYLKTSSYMVLKELLKNLFEINDNDRADLAAQKLENFIKRTNDSALLKIMSFFKYFLSLGLSRDDCNRFESMKPEDRIRLIQDAILSLLFKIAQRKPLVIIFDDCHWIDEETINFVRRLAETIAKKPIMIINLYRPEFNVGKPARLSYFISINLKPLPQDDTIVLLHNLLDCKKIEEKLLRFLLNKSGGLPFYIHELVSNLLNNNLIFVEDGFARLKSGMALTVPRTLDELVMAKIDKLNEELRRIVDIASVIGDEFSIRLLNELLQLNNKLKTQLSTIQDLDIIQPILHKHEKTIAEERYCFKHSIIRDAVYNSILKKELKKSHRAIGYAIEKIYRDNLNEYFDALANHFLLGGEYRKAVEYLEKAGDRKKELYLNEEAIIIYQKIIAMLDESQSIKIAQIHGKLGSIYELIGDYNRAVNSYMAMGSYSKDDSLVSARAYRSMANVVKNQGQFDKALSLLLKAKGILPIKKLTNVGMMMELSNILSLECWIYQAKGKIAEAEKKGLLAISMITDVKDWRDYENLKRALANAYANLAIVYSIKGEFEKAVDLCEDTLLIAEELGDQRRKASIYNILGTVYRSQGDYDQAIGALEMMLNLSEELGDKSSIGIAYTNLGNVYQNKGDFATAIELFEKHLKICEELNDKLGVGVASNNLGIIYYNKAEYARAVKSFEHYLKISEELGDRRGIAIALGNLGEVYASKFEHKKASELFKKYLKISEELGDKRGMAYASHNLGIAYTETDNLGIALAYLNSAKSFFETIGNKSALGNIYNSLAYLKIKENKLPDALEAANTAFKLAVETNSPEIKVNSFLNLGQTYGLKARLLPIKQAKNLLTKSAKNFKEAITLAKHLKNKRLLADVYYGYAKTLMLVHRQKDGQKIFKQALKIYKELHLEHKVNFLSSGGKLKEEK